MEPFELLQNALNMLGNLIIPYLIHLHFDIHLFISDHAM